jgi:hypothetical protein
MPEAKVDIFIKNGKEKELNCSSSSSSEDSKKKPKGEIDISFPYSVYKPKVEFQNHNKKNLRLIFHLQKYNLTFQSTKIKRRHFAILVHYLKVTRR